METVEMTDLFEAFRECGCTPKAVPQKLAADCTKSEKAMFAGFICGYQYAEKLNNTRVTLSASSTADDVKSCTE